MPPKKPSKTASIFQLWAKQQAQESARAERKRPFQPGEVVTICDSQEILEPAAPPAWTPLVRTSSSSFGGHSGSPGTSRTAGTAVQYLTDAELEELGMDSVAGTSICYPIDEYIRPYEMEILKKCLAANTCISLPVATCSVHLVALTFYNFIRWFPRSRCMYCCNSLDAAELFKSSCLTFGFKENDVAIFKDHGQFKKKASSGQDVGTVLVVTPQNMQKIVEQQFDLVNEIRCAALCIEPGEQHQKFAKIVGPMVGRGLSFRILIVHPSSPDGSRKTSSLSKRQQFITSLFITEWEEPAFTDPAFRLAAVPPGLRPVYWKTIDVSSDNSELYEWWKEGSTPLLEKFSSSIPLPSKDIDNLLNLDWEQLQKEANAISSELSIDCENCRFLIYGYRHLLLSGPRVFYLYCGDVLNKNDARSEQIQLMILGEKRLNKVFDKVQEKFAYNCDSPLNTTYNSLSLFSHVKFRQLSEEIESYTKKAKKEEQIKGLVLCESKEIARVVCEAICYIPSCDVILGVPSKVEIPPEYRNKCRNMNRMSGIFFQNKGVIVVMSFEDEAAFGALDTAASNGLTFIIATGRRSICTAEMHMGDYTAILSYDWERLRPTDGKVPDNVSETAIRRCSMGKMGVVSKYDFKYEPSKLTVNVSAKKLKFVRLSEEVASTDARTTTATFSRQGFELTAAEFAEYKKGVGKSGELPKSGIFTRGGLRVLNSEVPSPMKKEHLLWNKLNFSSSPLSGGDLTRTLHKYLSDRPSSPIPTKKAKTKRFVYDSYEDQEAILKYDFLISKLDRLLAM